MDGERVREETWNSAGASRCSCLGGDKRKEGAELQGVIGQ